MKRLTACAVLFSLALVACGGSDVEPQSRSTGADEKKSGKPDVIIPAGPPPSALGIEDLIAGTGKEAAPGTTVSVHYVGVSYSTRKQFDASWDRGEPFEFQLPGSVITGWNEGIPGMKVGGRRKLTIPPDKGYGPQGSPPDIKPNETLVFIVDLLEVR